MRTSIACALFIALMGGIAESARADLIVNGNFESGSFVSNGAGGMSLAPGSTTITGWTTSNAELAWLINGNAYDLATPYGSYFLDLTGYHDSSPYGGVYQDIATNIGQTYTLSFALGTQQSDGRYRGPVSLMASAGGISGTFTSDPTGAGNQWETFTLDFVATAITTRIELVGMSSGGGQYIGLDNVSVNDGSAVPEPASLVLLGMGLITSPLLIRRRIKSTTSDPSQR